MIAEDDAVEKSLIWKAKVEALIRFKGWEYMK